MKNYTKDTVVKVVNKRTKVLQEQVTAHEALIKEQEDKITELELLKDIENPIKVEEESDKDVKDLYDEIFPTNKK